MKRRFSRSSSSVSSRSSVCDGKEKYGQCSSHIFACEKAVLIFRKNLLQWYDHNKRDLQWRQLAKHEDPNVRGYSVLVSEIMLQQTQVATVKSYYEKWINKWPTLEALSKATLQEVHSMWAGLGYYSRGKRLHDTACKIVNEMSGIMPQDVNELRAKLPGVGPYTAAAVASIAYNQPVGAVDGNVIRVFSRVFVIGADTTQKHVVDKFWKLADDTVDHTRPGDFNQAMMELGALVCTPKQPKCLECPVSSHCKAYQRMCRAKEEEPSVRDIEDDPDCSYCLPVDEPWISTDGVMNYPRKRKKVAPKQARNVVVVVQGTSVSGNSDEEETYLLWQRPKQGLLASLWEFPSFTTENFSEPKPSELHYARNRLQEIVKTAPIERITYLGDVFHQFSHISQTYAVYHAIISRSAKDCTLATMTLPENYQAINWMNRTEVDKCAISTAMKKVMKFFVQSWSKITSVAHKRKRNLRGDNLTTK